MGSCCGLVMPLQHGTAIVLENPDLSKTVITCRFLLQPILSVHCHNISFCLVYVPMHVFPLPMYPVLQVQLYEPMLLLHCAFT